MERDHEGLPELGGLVFFAIIIVSFMAAMIYADSTFAGSVF